MNEKRNKQIYDWVIKEQLPVKFVCRLAGMTRQNVHRIVDMMIDKYGGQKPVNEFLLSPVAIDQEIADILEAECRHLGISRSAVIRLGINQAIKTGLKSTSTGGQKVGRTPMLYITAEQNEFMNTSNKTKRLQQILKSYQPIKIQKI